MMDTKLALLAVGALLAAVPANAAVNFTGSTTNFGASVAVIPGDPCPGVTLTITPAPPASATGASNLGAFMPYFTECPSGPPPSGALPVSEFTFVFADGSIFGNFSSIITNPGPVRFTATFDINGGTGRYGHAYGTLTALGAVNPNPAGGIIVSREITGIIDTPEPGAMALFGVALSGLWAARRRFGK